MYLLFFHLKNKNKRFSRAAGAPKGRRKPQKYDRSNPLMMILAYVSKQMILADVSSDSETESDD